MATLRICNLIIEQWGSIFMIAYKNYIYSQNYGAHLWLGLKKQTYLDT